MSTRARIQYADDDKTPLKRLLEMRLPSLGLGLILGVILSFITSRFDEVLSQNIRVAFFIPFVVYMAAAVGSQTQSIYTRDLRTGNASFHKYLVKETLIGIFIGVVTSIITALVVICWLVSAELALAVSLAMLGAVASAPPIAILVAEVLELEHKDPAVGSGPLATVIQDMVSIVIFGLISSWIIL